VAEQSGQVLVVDDNRVNRLKLSISLQQQGHVVTLAENGERALELLEATPFDVVLLDIVMPGLDGFEVLRRIKASPQLRDIPVIVVSALEETDSAVRCIEIGAEDYLPKPFDPVLLRARINSCLQKKKLRDLEKAYLRQEVTLRQSEKLVTLGRLSAGVAHELNNPAAAARRGASHLQAALSQLQEAHLALGTLSLSESQVSRLLTLDERARQKATQPATLDPLTLSDREYELESWLDDQDVEGAWDLAPTLVKLGYDKVELATLLEEFSPSHVRPVIAWLNHTYVVYSLLEEIGQGAQRISEIVAALKGYTYLGQGPVQNVSLHKGLDDTLIILRAKLPPRVTIRRCYDPDLPDIQAYGSELNQVWTNLIDNAIDAVNGEGEIVLRTRREDRWAVVSIEDSGPGIPEEIRAGLFDPFVTTKEPGKGTGLGLNISQNIVQKHKGTIEVHSRPGATSFEVRLPIGQVLTE
jgi:C4-dicarboxylate-specific signal transduction histidine kinase